MLKTKNNRTMSEKTHENEVKTPQDQNNENMCDNQTIENVSENVDLNENMTDESAIEKLQQEVASWKDQYVRLVAEFDNFKKRSFKERAEKQLETATDVKALKEGMQLVFNKLKHTLQQKGLKSFDSIGQAFDVEKHEAVTEIPAPSKKMEGKVIDELQKGYLLNDKLIRYAKVVIGKSNES